MFVWTDTAVPRFPPPAPGQRGVIPPTLRGLKRLPSECARKSDAAQFKTVPDHYSGTLTAALA